MNQEAYAKIVSYEVQEFIFNHEGHDEAKLSLKHNELFGIPFSLIAQQLVGRRKAKTKLPTFFNTSRIVYPPALNIEQSSSEATATYKKKLIEEMATDTRSIADLTGGLGVDSFLFSKLFSSVCYVEPNSDLLALAKRNHHVLGATNIQYHHSSAETFLNSTDERFDFIYIDPSRRSESNKKLFRLADTQPNVVELLPKMLARTQYVLIKTSPLLDIHQGIAELSNAEKIFVVSVANECKELLFLVNKKFAQEPSVHAVDLNLDGRVTQDFSFHLSEERNSVVAFSSVLNYLYEPSTAILKSGAFKLVATRHRLSKLSSNTHLYTSDEIVSDFPGRIFKVEKVNPSHNDLAAMLPDRRANVTTRNYPLSPDQLKTKLKLRDGGEKFVIGFSEQAAKKIVVATRVK